MRTFIRRDGASPLFWNVDLQDNRIVVTAGRMDALGTTKVRCYDDADAARAAQARLIRKRLADGYIETTPAPVPPLQKALEDALIANPGDLASHMAYADYLIEPEDPRGQLIQIQLELESLLRTSTRQADLRKRALRLVNEHGRAWLGELAPYLLEQSHTY